MRRARADTLPQSGEGAQMWYMLAPDSRARRFGANLRSVRERTGLTQEALGHRADFHPTEVNRIERGRRKPGLLTIVKLAKALHVPAGDLLAGL